MDQVILSVKRLNIVLRKSVMQIILAITEMFPILSKYLIRDWKIKGSNAINIKL